MEQEIEKIDAWFRLANYISVAQMYLKDNIFLEEKLKKEHLKEYVAGHWGVSPSINFIYAHLISYVSRKNKKMQIIIGEGHAGSALLTNLYIEKQISEYYKEYPYNCDGLKNLIRNFGTTEGFRSEINPSYPNTIYDGGELGYSLPVAIGSSIKNKGFIIPCIIGDGEAETGTISASWHLNKVIDNKENGYVLPILNLNGYKMGSESIFSKFDDKELQMYFEAMGYRVFFVHESHKEMYEALEAIDEKEKSIIILKTRKGWTAVEDDKITIEGNRKSHKNPLAQIANIEQKVKYLERWLKSYKIEELISKKAFFEYDINNNILEEGNILDKDTKEIYPKELKEYEIKEKQYSNMRGIQKYLEETIKRDNQFMIFSPDELESNFLGELLENKETKSNVIEVLNENICQALLQGHINSGKRGVLISYEAFMPIITSMLSQYEKYIYQNAKIGWRKPLNSMTYILTSVCWENNYSHQNPEFLSSALEKDFDFINVYTPIDANSLIVALDKSIHEKNKINIIDISKRIKKQYKTMKQAKISIEQGIEIFSETKGKKVSVVIAAIGDYLIEEVIVAKEELEKLGIGCRIIYISKINILKELNKDEIEKYFGKEEIIYIATHTYASIIKSLMFDFRDRKIVIEGYKDKSDIAGNYKVKLERNNLTSSNIIQVIQQTLKGEL